jgi:multidrug efflux system outer membrane protein
MKKLLFFLLFSGCMMGPKYHAPEICVNDTWNAEEDAAEEAPLQKWWEVFEDDLLNKYIDLAKNCNYDIQAAEANILRARALRLVAASKLFPHVNLDINGTKTYFSKNGPVFAIGQATGDPTDTTSSTTNLPFTLQIPQIQNLYNALFDAVWELDLFGKTRHRMQAALAEYESMIEQKNDILISVYAEVARNYIDLRSYQKKAHLLEGAIQLFENQAEIIRLSLEVGYSNQLDFEQIEAKLAEAKASLPDAYSEVYRSIYALSVLVGTPPETFVEELLIDRPLVKAPTSIAIGLRSDLLRRRPDVRYRERKLAEATAMVGVAVASFFPTVSLLSGGGFQSLLLPQLFEWGSKTWAYGADVNMPIFRGGELIGNLRLSKAEQAMAAAYYQQTVLKALQDAESSLKKYLEQVEVTKQLDDQVIHTQHVVSISKERYLKGLVNRIDFIDHEKELISAQLMQLESQNAELSSLISLYKALGGGWE